MFLIRSWPLFVGLLLALLIGLEIALAVHVWELRWRVDTLERLVRGPTSGWP